MSVIHNDLLLSSDNGGYTIAKSLRLRSSASAYLSRTPSSTGDRQKWTWSGWVKRGYLGDLAKVLAAFNNSGNSIFAARFEANNTLNIYSFNTATEAYIWQVQTTQVFRDPSAWYHIVLAVDTTQATAANRLKLYVNGSQVTAFSTSSYPSQNTNTELNASGYSMQIATGTANNSTYAQFYDGYLADTYLIDGTQKAASDFGETDAITGVWKPKAYTGTYGTNGFYLPFTDVATTSGSNAGLGKDFSGNGNYWNTNNISVTSGSTYDSMKDVPTLTDANTANYAVMNPLQSTTPPTNGNLTLSGASAGTWYASVGTIGMSSGKYYFEVNVQALAGAQSCHIGIVPQSYAVPTGTYIGNTATSYGYRQDGTVYNNNGGTSYGASFAGGDLIGVALDLDNGTLVFYKNGTSQGTAASGLSGMYFFAFSVNNGSGATVIGNANFGQQPFAYTPPTGYKALNTYNLPDSTIVAGNEYMDATTYTGNGSTQTITNAGAFKPDFVWMKGRNYAVNNVLNDSVRGISKFLFSDSTSAELTNTGYGVTAFNSNGFTAVDDSAGAYGANGSSKTYVAWQWQAGQGTTSSNTSGSITSTVSVNASAGFSIVTYTGNGSSGATVGHGLGVAPKMVIVKRRNSTESWSVTTPVITGSLQYGWLNLTDAFNAAGESIPTSTVFYPNNGTSQGANGSTYVAYCWAEVDGYSKIGKYTGNGSADGPFIFTGFRPKFIMTKRTDSTSNWCLLDTTRNPYNVASDNLTPNSSGTGDTIYGYMDFTSNGIKMRNSDSSWNASGGTYIYMAFAENPFKNSLAR